MKSWRAVVVAVAVGLLLAFLALPVVASGNNIYPVYKMTATVELRDYHSPNGKVVVTLRNGDYAVLGQPKTVVVGHKSPVDGLVYLREEMWAYAYKATIRRDGTVKLGAGGWVNDFDFLTRAKFVGGRSSTPPEMPSRQPKPWRWW